MVDNSETITKKSKSTGQVPINALTGEVLWVGIPWQLRLLDSLQRFIRGARQRWDQFPWRGGQEVKRRGCSPLARERKSRCSSRGRQSSHQKAALRAVA